MDPIRRWGPWLLLALAAISTLSFAWQNRDMPGFGSMQDDAVYMLSARSISLGTGYRVAQLPGQPAQTKYPPLFPAVLAMLWAWHPDFPANLALAAAFGAIAYLVFLWLSYRIFRQYGLKGSTAILLTAAAAANATVIHLSLSVLTELPFTVLLLGTLLTSEAAASRPWRWSLASGALAACAYLTRTAALPLAVTVPMILRGRRRHALAFVAGMAPAIAGWQAWVSAHPPPTRDWLMLFHTDYVGLERASVGWNNVADVAYTNIDALLTGLGDLLVFTIGRTSLGHHLGRLVAVGALIGVIRLCRQSHRWQYAAYALASCLLLSIWCYPPNERFTVPLVPLLLAGLWTECKHLGELIRSSWRQPAVSYRVAAAAFATALVAFLAVFVWSSVETRLVEFPAAATRSRMETEKLRTAFTAVARQTPMGAVILSDCDGLLYLYTGRRSYRTVIPPRLFYPMDTANIQAVFAEMPDAGGRPWEYALVTQADWGHTLGPAGRADVRKRIEQRGDLTVLYRDEFATLYRRISQRTGDLEADRAGRGRRPFDPRRGAPAYRPGGPTVYNSSGGAG